MIKVKTVSEAVQMIKSGSTIAIGGFIGIGHPEEITSEIENRFQYMERVRMYVTGYM